MAIIIFQLMYVMISIAAILIFVKFTCVAKSVLVKCLLFFTCVGLYAFSMIVVLFYLYYLDYSGSSSRETLFLGFLDVMSLFLIPGSIIIMIYALIVRGKSKNA